MCGDLRWSREAVFVKPIPLNTTLNIKYYTKKIIKQEKQTQTFLKHAMKTEQMDFKKSRKKII